MSKVNGSIGDPTREKPIQVTPHSWLQSEADENGSDIDKSEPEVPINELESISIAPERGFEAWLVVLGAWCCSFCCFGWINSIGVFQAYYETNLLKQYSSSTISWIPSLEVFLVQATGPVVGKIYDNYGPRYILLFGTLAHVFGLMMASVSTQYYQFILSQGMCSAIGASAIFLPSLNAVSTWFIKKRGLAFGITFTGSSTGGVIFPIMVRHLIDNVGYPWAMRICAFMILVLLVVANLTVRARTPPARQPPLSVKEFFAPLLEPVFGFTCLGCFIFQFGLLVPINYIIVQAMAGGMSTSLANYLVSMLNGASLFGRIIPGVLADKLGRYNIFLGVSFFTGILVLALWIPASGNAATIVFAIGFGFSSGGFISLGPALVAQISPIERIGVRQGLLLAVQSIGALTTNPIAGAIIEHQHGSYTGIKIFSGVMCLVGATITLVARYAAVGLSFKRF